MKSGEQHRVKGDPSFIGKRGKSASQRKGRYDAGWTPSEQRVRAKCMKQFCRLEGPSGNGEAYTGAECWDPVTGRLKP